MDKLPKRDAIRPKLIKYLLPPGHVPVADTEQQLIEAASRKFRCHCRQRAQHAPFGGGSAWAGIIKKAGHPPALLPQMLCHLLAQRAGA
ncbi:hypothetical protein N008_03910 [Hymenobacter sp. APR13]|nr:hypothetical protein N008_03910 [Hymenobacter sp. APR13]